MQASNPACWGGRASLNDYDRAWEAQVFLSREYFPSSNMHKNVFLTSIGVSEKSGPFAGPLEFLL